MQLDMFGGVEPTEPTNDGVPLDFTDLQFGPLHAIEQASDVAFLHTVPQEQLEIRDNFFSSMKKDRIAAIMEQAALENTVTVSAIDGRKSFVKPEVMPMIMDRLNGSSFIEIGRKFNKPVQTVYSIFNRPSTRQFIAKLIGEYAAELGDVEARIKAHATEAIETQVHIMRNGKEDNRMRASFNILRMAGYDQSASARGSGVVINNSNNVQINEDTVNNTEKLLTALAESREARIAGFHKHIDTRRLAGNEVSVIEAPLDLPQLATGTNG